MKNESAQFIKSIPVNQSKRLYYFDWFRIITIIAVFFHHCSKIFDIRNSHTTTSLLPTIHREFDNLWMMPLFFIISGAAVHYSMKTRKPAEFIKERLLRILLPLLTIGTFVIAPPLVYVEKLINGEFSDNFFRWYPYFFKNEYPHNSGHLWFLFFLFIYTLILLPFFIPIGKQRMSIFSRFSNLFKNSWGLLLLFIPFIAMSPLEIYSNRLAGGWDFLPYLLFFICGYLFFSNDRIRETIGKYYIVNLITASVLTIIYLYIEFSSFSPVISSYMLTEYKTLLGHAFNPPDLSIALLGFFVLRHIVTYCWILAIIGLGRRFLNFSNKLLEYGNEAVLPFYILHMTVIYVIAYFVIYRSISILGKYVIIVISSFIGIMLIYEFLVRRVNILRLLFGMKLKKSIKG